jgi:outer membrane protein assembly factor BamB
VAYAFGSTPGSDDTYPRLWTSPDLGVSGSRDPGEPAGPANIGPDGDVYVVTTRGSVFRLNGATGTVVWQRTGLGPASSMAVFTRDDQRLIVSTGRAVRALRVLDGQQVWRTQHSSTMGPPAVAPDGTIVVGDAAGDLRGLNPRTGAPRWMRSLSFPIIHPAAFGFAGEAYVPAGKRLSGVNVSNGSVLWTRELEGTAFAPIVGHDGRVYVGGGTDLVCTLPNGDLVWKNTVPVGTGPMTMDAMATLYMATGNGRLLRVGQTFYHAGRRGVSIGSASAEELRSIWTLTHQADGNALTIHGRRVASPARAFARIWLDQRQVLVPWGFGPDGARRAVPFARVRALVRATHSGPVTLRVQMVQEGRGYSDVHNRTLAPGWQWVEFTVPAEQFQTTVRPFEALLRFDGEGDVSQSTAEIDLFELAHLYTFWPEPE